MACFYTSDMFTNTCFDTLIMPHLVHQYLEINWILLTSHNCILPPLTSISTAAFCQVPGSSFFCILRYFFSLALMCVFFLACTAVTSNSRFRLILSVTIFVFYFVAEIKYQKEVKQNGRLAQLLKLSGTPLPTFSTAIKMSPT